MRFHFHDQYVLNVLCSRINKLLSTSKLYSSNSIHSGCKFDVQLCPGYDTDISFGGYIEIRSLAKYSSLRCSEH